MFGLFKSKEPLDYEKRKWIENNILWLEQEFPEPPIEERIIFTLEELISKVEWNRGSQSLKKLLDFIASNMQISTDEIVLDIYKNAPQELSTGSTPIFLEEDVLHPQAGGLYFEKDSSGKYTIAIEEKQSQDIDTATAILAHELSHIKLLGEKRLEENDEYITDLATVLFGFGIFSANTCFRYYQSANSWGYSSSGYLNQEEWAYALALIAFIKGDDNPKWSTCLEISVKKYFDRSLKYMLENEDEIFRFDDE